MKLSIYRIIVIIIILSSLVVSIVYWSIGHDKDCNSLNTYDSITTVKQRCDDFGWHHFTLIAIFGIYTIALALTCAGLGTKDEVKV